MMLTKEEVQKKLLVEDVISGCLKMAHNGWQLCDVWEIGKRKSSTSTIAQQRTKEELLTSVHILQNCLLPAVFY